MSRATPENLFERYRRDGDVESLARLFDSTAPEVYRVARFLSGNEHEAEDLLQTTFVVVIERASSFREGGRVMPWLLGILANKARGRHERREQEGRRQRNEQRRREIERAGEPVSAPDGDPVAAAQERELRAHLQRELERLAPDLRLALALHLLHHLGAADIARALDRPAGTVRSQICRGMEQLRRALPRGLTGSGIVAAVSPQLLAQARQVVLARAREFALPASTTALSGVVNLLPVPMALMMKTEFLFGFVAATLVIAAVFLWQPWIGVVDPPLAPAVSAAGVMTGSSTRLAIADETVSSASPHREALQVPASPLVGGRGWLVQIVDEATGEGVAGAEVGALPEGGEGFGSVNRRILAREDLPTYEPRDGGTGHVGFTDAGGFVRIPGRMKASSAEASNAEAGSVNEKAGWIEISGIVVRKGKLYGMASLRRREVELPETAQIVTVAEDRSAAVRVVDGDGRPLPYAPVGTRPSRNSSLQYVGMSKAPAGVLLLRHLQRYGVPRDADGRRILRVGPYAVGLQSDGVPIDVDAPPAKAVTLRHPPTGSLVVRLRDALGDPWRQGRSALGQPSDGDPLWVQVRALSCQDGPIATALVDPDGQCVVPFIALAQDLHISLVTGHPFALACEVEGPERAGEVVRVELAAPAPATTLVGRLVLPSGQPAAARLFAVAGEGYRLRDVRTDADGRFRIGMKAGSGPAPVGGSVDCCFLEKDSAAEPHWVCVAIPAGVAMEVGLGDLALTPTPLLVAGRIVDEPAGEHVSLRVKSTGAEWPAPVTLRREDGRYEVRGLASHAARVLRVRGGGQLPQELPFVPGQKDLDIRLAASARIEVRALFAKDVEAGAFVFRMVPDAATQGRIEGLELGDRTALRRLHRGQAGEGYVWWSDVVPGRYRLDCFCIGCPGPILQVDDIHVVAGTRQDPRLAAVDLRGRVEWTILTIRDAAGVPRDGRADVWDPEPAASRILTNLLFKNGELRLGLRPSAGPLDILVSSVGCRSKLVTGVLGLGQGDVQLEPGIGVRFVLPDGFAELPRKTRRELVLVAKVDPGTTPFAARGGSWTKRAAMGYASAARGEADDFTLMLPVVGTYRLRLELRDPDVGRSVALRLPASSAAVVVEDRADQVFELALDERVLAAAVAELTRTGR